MTEAGYFKVGSTWAPQFYCSGTRARKIDTAASAPIPDTRNDLDWSTRHKAKKSVKSLKGKTYLGNGRSNPNTIILAAF